MKEGRKVTFSQIESARTKTTKKRPNFAKTAPLFSLLAVLCTRSTLANLPVLGQNRFAKTHSLVYIFVREIVKSDPLRGTRKGLFPSEYKNIPLLFSLWRELQSRCPKRGYLNSLVTDVEDGRKRKHSITSHYFFTTLLVL